jgi:hypothetical protein
VHVLDLVLCGVFLKLKRGGEKNAELIVSIVLVGSSKCDSLCLEVKGLRFKSINHSHMGLSSSKVRFNDL